ncbi:MAG: M28 family peptidase [Pirellulaceae bacterium]
MCAWLIVICLAGDRPLTAGEKNEASAARLLDSVRVLAADEMEGRGIGTEGIDAAAEYIACQFEEIGLRTDLFEGTPFQVFEIGGQPELGPADENRLALRGPAQGDLPAQIRCELGKDFMTLAAGGSARAQGPLVFVGYGISAEEWKYDDYAGIDVRGKIVVMLRKEPQQGDPTSIFNGLRPSVHASFREKIKKARDHGVAAVLMINDDFDIQSRRMQQQKAWRQAMDKLTAVVEEFRQLTTLSPEAVRRSQVKLAELAHMVSTLLPTADLVEEELLDFHEAGRPEEEAAMPLFFCRRSVLQPIVQQTFGIDLATLERQMDAGPTPHSRELTGWTAECQSSLVQIAHRAKNVVGVCEGAGALADETIVIGAHYDHLGHGSKRKGEVYNGADDNASGTSGLLEIARRLIANDEPSHRRLVFVAFAGEELGLLGSAQYVKAPPFPLETTVAMINLDMIGRLRDGKLTIGGTASAAEFDGWIEELNQSYAFKISKMPNGLGPSDHASFYRQNVPVLFFFTGVHADYHQPTDDTEKINVDGMLRITEFVTEIVGRLDDAVERPTYRQTARPRRPTRTASDESVARPYLGCVPDASRVEAGVALLSVAANSPAERGGLQPADILVQFGEDTIGRAEDLSQSLQKHKPGDRVAIVVRRGVDRVTLSVTLGEPR